ncbi:MAG: hypothetical protein ACW990_18675, partial [Promethearchaeota archaeon]
MAAQLFYGQYEFIPVPLFSWSTDTVRDGKGDAVSLAHTLSFTGTLLETPSESGQFDLLFARRGQLQQALASGNQEFRILFNGIPQLSGIFPKVSNVTFDEGTWTTRIDYSFTFDYEEDFFSTSVQSFTE